MGNNGIKLLTSLGGVMLCLGILLALAFKSFAMLLVALPGAVLFVFGLLLDFNQGWQRGRRDE